jgi:hypothetical protein
MSGTNRRELDYRQSKGAGLRVRRLWNQRSHKLSVKVDDPGVERVPALQNPTAARNSFMHPFAYMP